MRIALVACLLAAACGTGAGARRGTPAGGDATPGVEWPDPTTIAVPDWDFGLRVEPAITDTEVGPERAVVKTVPRGDLGAGVFTFSITRDEARAQKGSRALGEAAAEAWRAGDAAQVFEPQEVTFLGLPGHAYVFTDGEATGLEVIAVSGPCVYDLIVMRAGGGELMKAFAGELLRNLHTLSGEAASARRCR